MKYYVRSVVAGGVILCIVMNLWVGMAVIALMAAYALVRWCLADFPNDDR